MEDDFKIISIQKNRGWRGLSEVSIYNEERRLITSMIFSFSQKVWNDMLDGYIVIPYKDYYYIVNFDNLSELPSRTQQRSVLIKNFQAHITNIQRIEKEYWMSCPTKHYSLIVHFLINNNKHTQSNWNYVGIRVIPKI